MRGVFLVAKVAVSRAAYSFDSEYSYIVPEELKTDIKAGARVLVPFGSANRQSIGFVTRIYESTEFNEKLKPIAKLIDTEPLLTAEMLRIIFWLKENTFCTFFDAYRTVIPTGFGYSFSRHFTLANTLLPDGELEPAELNIINFMRGAKNQREIDDHLDLAADARLKKLVGGLIDKGYIEESGSLKRRVGDETVKMVRLSDYFISETAAGRAVTLTARQKQVAELLQECDSASVREICYMTSSTPSLISRMVKKGLLTEFKNEVMRSVQTEPQQKKDPEDIILNDEQQQAFEGISRLIDSGKAAGALLYGVTGSGKTAVFFRLIDSVVKRGRSALMLVPEISLTPQMVSRFRTYFGSCVAVLHSSLSLGQRTDEFKRIKRGEAKIVVGTRSAVFAPFGDLGIIIMDEEGEHSYKSESSPRYHARDVAIQRCGYSKCVLVMASATPSLETFYFAKNGRFSLFEMKSRYADAVLPQVEIIDMQQEENDRIFSRRLLDRIGETLDRKEQVILLLNRRGFSTCITCLDCKSALSCPKCGIPLTYHKKNNKLMCHYCGFTMNDTDKCPVCGSDHLRRSGIGTQRIEEELAEHFPNARLLRMDADTTYSRYSYEENFRDFENGKYDIMLGTQMIAKGLNFPDVTLVGVVSLDKALFTGDFRSYERTFSLITQVAGRSGRGQKPGYACLQTYVPDHYVLNLAAAQDYDEFYNQEIALRRSLMYPPFCDICVVGFSSELESKAIEASEWFAEEMSRYIRENNIEIPLRALGPAPCTFGRINNKYRYRLILKCRSCREFRSVISQMLIRFYKNKDLVRVSIYADINGDIGL